MNPGPVRVWDLATNKQVLALPSRSNWVAFHPDGRRLATADQDGAVRLWDAETGKQLTTLGGVMQQAADGPAAAAGPPGPRKAITEVAFSSDGRRLMAAADEISCPRCGTCLTGRSNDLPSIWICQAGAATWPRARTAGSAACGAWDGTVKLYDADVGTGIVHAPRPHRASASRRL